MLSNEQKEYISELVDLILKDLKKNHLLKDTSNAVYDEVSEILTAYYRDGETNENVKKALDDFKDDLYWNIIPMYFKEKYTIESIAEIFNVDVSTIVRNKKRLCLSLYLLLE